MKANKKHKTNLKHKAKYVNNSNDIYYIKLIRRQRLSQDKKHISQLHAFYKNTL